MPPPPPGARGSGETFQGRRRPKDPTKAAEFDEKRRLYFNARKKQKVELMKRQEGEAKDHLSFVNPCHDRRDIVLIVHKWPNLPVANDSC